MPDVPPAVTLPSETSPPPGAGENGVADAPPLEPASAKDGGPGLRQRIDRLDEEIHDRIIARARLVLEAGESDTHESDAGQTAQAAFAHALNEITVLRRLAARHQGPLPFTTVTRIWREMILGTAAIRHPVNVALYEDEPAARETARDHFGAAPLAGYRSIGQVIRAVTERTAQIGLLPLPREEEADPWWRQLLSREPDAPRIVARLPFLPHPQNRPEAGRPGSDLLAIACGQPVAEACERAFIAFELSPEISRARLLSQLEQAGFGPYFLALHVREDHRLALVGVKGPVAVDDARFQPLIDAFDPPLGRIFHLGGYREPLTAG